LGTASTCLVAPSGQLTCFGYVRDAREFDPRDIEDIRLGQSHICVLLKSGALGCVGNNASNELGSCATGITRAPVRVILDRDADECAHAPIPLYVRPPVRKSP
jgi:hypothetical protein